MTKGYEENKEGRKKAKWTLKERRQKKREKKMRQQEGFSQHTDVVI